MKQTEAQAKAEVIAVGIWGAIVAVLFGGWSLTNDSSFKQVVGWTLVGLAVGVIFGAFNLSGKYEL